MTKIKFEDNRNVVLFNILFSILIVLNIIGFKQIPSLGFQFDKFFDENQSYWQTPKLLTSSYYDYNSAIKDLKKEKLQNNYYVAGLTYGAFNMILNGSTLDEYNSIKKIYDNQNQSDTYSFDKIDDDKDIEVILITDVPRIKLIKKFELSPNWKHWKDFYSAKYHTKIICFKRI